MKFITWQFFYQLTGLIFNQFSWWKYFCQHFRLLQCELNKILLLIDYFKTSAQFHLWIMEKEKYTISNCYCKFSPLQKKVYSNRNENSSQKRPSNLLSSFFTSKVPTLVFLFLLQKHNLFKAIKLGRCGNYWTFQAFTFYIDGQNLH